MLNRLLTPCTFVERFLHSPSGDLHRRYRASDLLGLLGHGFAIFH